MSFHRILARFAMGLTLAAAALAASAQSTMVRLHTTQGPIDFKLLDAEAPRTVANFLAYVRGGAYAGTLVHRSVRNFVIQGGGYLAPAQPGVAPHIATNAPVANEFSPTRSNLRGTVAMAKVGGNPDSATSEWFVNLADNSQPCPPIGSRAGLDCQNGGFTVFARVTSPGMVVVDKISALPIVNTSSVYGSALDNQPVASTPVSTSNWLEKSVLVTEVSEFPPLASQSDFDRVTHYLEAAYPQFLSPARGQAGTAFGYTFRYYSGTNAYVATKDGRIDVYLPAVSPDLVNIGPLADWLGVAMQAGY